MERLSSGQTFLLKRALPVLWLVMVVAIVASVASVAYSNARTDEILVVAISMLAAGAGLYWKLIACLADDVRDGGAFLLVRKDSIEQRVAVADIVNVGNTQYTNPPRMSVRLRNPCDPGDDLVFFPRSPWFRLNPFARNVVAEALIRRVDRARGQQEPIW